MTTLTGDKQLDRKLKRLGEKGASRASRAGIRASLTPVAQAMRKAVTASDASPDLKRAARKTIKSRFAKSKFGLAKGQRQAKVGFGVGKKKEAQRSGNNTGGVGVSQANIHWFVLGTRHRWTRDNRYTGRVEPVFAGLAEQALNASKTASLAKAREKIKKVIDKEARKR